MANSNFQSDMAALLEVSVYQVLVNHIAAGSVVVDFTVNPDTRSAATVRFVDVAAHM
jgi:hypothetical protein